MGFDGTLFKSNCSPFKTYYGSSSENPLFRQVLDDFYTIYGFYPKIVDQDRGSDSKEKQAILQGEQH